MLVDKIQSLLGEVSGLEAFDEKGLEELRIKYLSKKGIVNELMTEFRSVASDQKREVGMKLNELKTALQDKIAEIRMGLACREDDHTDSWSRHGTKQRERSHKQHLAKQKNISNKQST